MEEKIITRILNYSVNENASDIHIAEGFPLSFRINGELVRLPDSSIITNEKIYKIINELLNGDEQLIENFLKNKDIDFAFTNFDNTSFRVNGFFKRGKPAFVLRRIAKEPHSINSLMLPPGANSFTKLKQGLILITGPTGSGKSTTMVAILEEINKTRKEHIITIEDPIEFIFKNKESVFSQRELGIDTKSFHSSLRASMREDPDIIMIGEMRDKETVEAALELAETGHLVISTLHTSSAVQTIVRLLSFFPLDTQKAISERIAGSIQGILSQRLIPRADKKGRIGIFELFMANSGVVNQIREGKINQMQCSIETGKKDGMISMKGYAELLEAKGFIHKKDYINYFKKEDNN